MGRSRASRNKKENLRYKDYYASIEAGGKKDYFGTFWDSMAKSEPFQQLSLASKYFYILCRVEWKSSHGRAYLYKHAEEEGKEYREPCFAFPAEHMELYGIKRQNGSKYMKELIKAGFIVCEERNGHRRKPNIYAFSDGWKQA